MLDPHADFTVLGAGFFLALQQRPTGAFAVLDDQARAAVRAVAGTVTP
ncbi:hypothetical protein ACH4FX_31880 [Streptomyces sp. NPDC018019]